LTACIFGSKTASSNDDERYGDGSFSSSSLFGSKERFQKVSRGRHQENLKAAATVVKESSSSSPMTRKEILKRRRDRTASTRDVVDSVTVDLPELPSSSASSASSQRKEDNNNNNIHDNDNDIDDIQKGILRLFVGQAGAVFRNQGVLILKASSSSNDDGGAAKLCSDQLLQKLRSKTKRIETKVCDRLDELGKQYRRPEAGNEHDRVLAVDSDANNNNNNNNNHDQEYAFRYHEVASRCLGRLDIRHGMDQPPFCSKEILQNPYLMAMVHELLGHDAVLVYAGLILSFADSADQPWHQDGSLLFPKQQQEEDLKLPPYALNIFIPVSPITETLGPTEFWIKSHLDGTGNVMKQLLHDTQDPSNPQQEQHNDKIIGPLLQPGDALLYDYRICHRGTRNLSTATTSNDGETRPMLYLMYARPWFQEHLNFGTDRLFATSKTKK
jgi:hypothetical protein